VKIVSVNVGKPREVPWQGRQILTGIFKEPVDGRIMMRRLNLEGDGQADLTVHGGVDKAVYAYPAEHYPFWRNELPGMNLPWGVFGENLTVEGVSEKAVFVGDRFRIGDAEVVATQPRMPCYKLGLRFQWPEMTKRFLASRRSGFYFAVEREGTVAAGDTIELIRREPESILISDVTRLYAFEKTDREGLQRAIKTKRLPENWRSYFQHQLEKIEK
jgi:MOSC domain-containing protein YiiM